MNISQKKIYFKNIGISKYPELNRPISLHFNRKYKQALEENPSIFRVYRGLFSAMYDNAIKNGNIYPPFETKTVREHNKKLKS